MSKSRRIYAGILAAAAGGLIVDMTLLRDSGPAAANAGVAAQQHATPSELEATLAQLREQAPARRSALAEALDLFGTNAPIDEIGRSAFGVPVSLRAVTQQVEDQRIERADDADRSRLRLSTVVMGQRPVALISGRIYAVGETVEPQGWTVVSIDRGGVALERDGRTTVLELSAGR